MSILANVTGWVNRAIVAAKPLLKKAEKFVSKATVIVNALADGRDLLDREENPKEKSSTSNERPNVISDFNDSSCNDLEEIYLSIDESKKKLDVITKNNEQDHKRIQLQIDIMELIVSSSTFERFTNNVSIHASNLQIHLQAIHNTSGIMDQLDRHRRSLKALMGTVNHLINITDQKGSVKKLEGIDVDIKPQSISIKSAYEAFENTRNLLLNEIDQFSASIDMQLKRVESVRAAARKVPNQSKKVNDWLVNSVEPSLIEARNSAAELSGELVVIPKLENNIRRKLEDIENDGPNSD